MGLIDPMVISNAAASGVIAFSTGPALWAVTVALLGSAATAILFAARPFRSARRRTVTSLGTLRLFAPASAVAK
jgi:hypothetical protein